MNWFRSVMHKLNPCQNFRGSGRIVSSSGEKLVSSHLTLDVVYVYIWTSLPCALGLPVRIKHFWSMIHETGWNLLLKCMHGMESRGQGSQCRCHYLDWNLFHLVKWITLLNSLHSVWRSINSWCVVCPGVVLLSTHMRRLGSQLWHCSRSPKVWCINFISCFTEDLLIFYKNSAEGL